MLTSDGRRTTDDVRRTMDGGPCLYYKLTSEPKGSGELKTQQYIFYTDIKFEFFTQDFIE